MPEHALGAFLRSRRDRLRPADVGLPDNGRRRTPGLRREEVATLAGISIDYLVRLEQGKDRNPSPSVVRALGDALRLSPDEFLHLQQLSQCAGASELYPNGMASPAGTVPDTVLALLDRLTPTPAVVLGPWYDVLAHNDPWEAIMRPLGALDREPPNLAAFTFLDPRAREAFPDWTTTADDQVAVLRDASIPWSGEAGYAAIVDELRTVPEFAARWDAHPVARKRRGDRVVRHPDAGDLRLTYQVLHIDDDADQLLVVWLPADEATESAIRRLAGGDAAVSGAPADEVPTSPARLRVVGDG